MSPTAWDVRMFFRGLGAASGALALAWLVTAATDEGGVEWGERLGRALPLAPLCAALGVAAALVPARWRGEVLALGALGRSPVEVGAAAAAGGAAVSFGAALVAGLARAVPVDGFYPAAPRAAAWRWDGASFVDMAHARSVSPDGAPHRLAASQVVALAGSLPAHARAAAGLTTALAGLGLAVLAAHAILSRPQDARWSVRDPAVLASAAALVASVAFFQAAAAGLVTPLAAVIPALGLLAYATRRATRAP